MTANRNSADQPENPFATMPPEWVSCQEAVRLVAKDQIADIGEIARGLVTATVEGTIPCEADFAAYRAADPNNHVWHISDSEDLTSYFFEPNTIDWITGSVRVFQRDTTRSMVMPVLLHRAAVLRWAKSVPLVGRLSPTSVLRPAGPPPVSIAEASTWMTANVRPDSKREPTLRDCMAATQCTYRIATEAWNALPADLRGTRGRPKR